MRARLISILVCFVLCAAACSSGGGLTEQPAIASQGNLQLLDLTLTVDGALAAVFANGTNADLLRVYELKTGNQLWRAQFGDGVTLFSGDFYFTPDSQQVAVWLQDSTRNDGFFVRYFEARTGNQRAEFALNEREMLLAAAADQFVTGQFTTLRLRDAETGAINAEVEFPSQVDFARYIDGGTALLAGHGVPGGQGLVLNRLNPATLAPTGDPVTISPLSGTNSRSVWVNTAGSLIAGTVINGQETWAADAVTGTQTYGLPAAAVANERVTDPRFTSGSGILADGRYVYLTNAGYITAVKLDDDSWTILIDLERAYPNALAVSMDGKTIAILEQESLRSWRLP